MFTVLLGWIMFACTANGQPACVDDACQDGVRTNSLLQSGSEKTKLEAATLEDDQIDVMEHEHANAQGYILGGLGSSNCPGGYDVITSFSECQKALPALGEASPSQFVIGDHPYGCQVRKDGGGQDGLAIFNTNHGPNSHTAIKRVCGSVTPAPTVYPTVLPTQFPTPEPTAEPTQSPTDAEAFHATKGTEHSSYQKQFSSDCEPCITAEKYAADNATECAQKHTDAQQDAVSVGEAEEALAACEKEKLAAEAAAAIAKAEVKLKLTQIASATASDDTQGTKEGADELCANLMDDWIAKKNAVVSCDDKAAKLTQSKAAYGMSGPAAKACDVRAETAKAQAAVACANLVDTGGQVDTGGSDLSKKTKFEAGTLEGDQIDVMEQEHASARSYILGSIGSANCPSGYDVITTLSECQKAASALGEASPSQYNIGDHPYGCQVRKDGGGQDGLAIFNTNHGPNSHTAIKKICVSQ